NGTMSYINDALRKAQRERDGRYERFGDIIAPCLERPGQPRKRRLAIGAAITLLILIPAGLLLTVYVLHQPPPVKKGPPVPVVAGPPAALQSATPQAEGATAMGEAVPAGKAPAGRQAEKAAIQTGGKPVPSVAAASPGGTPVPREAEVRYKEALSAQRRGDFKRAEALYQRVLVLDPGHVRALNNLGVICLGQKKRERAIDLFSKAIALKKDYVDPYYNLACLYAQTNEIDESLWYLKVAMTINGDVKNWVEKDADMKNVLASPAFKKIMEGQKN
ncbi:MAG: tetratricopeptide repeat protein, partial [Pseudomonadota bacterium]